MKFDLVYVRQGFNRFFEENGHYPSSKEINACDYIPSTRYIQRNFNGLNKLRSLLGIQNTDHRKGEMRSELVRKSNDAAYAAQGRLGTLLRERFGQKNINSYTSVSDTVMKNAHFLVRHQGGRFFTDITNASDYASFIGCLNFKIKKYSINTTDKIYLINANPDIPINLSRKKNPIPPNLQVVSLSDFMKEMENYKPINIAK